MRIFQLISSQGLYGAENVLLNLSIELHRQGHSCVVGVFQDSRKPNIEVATRAQELGLATAVIPCRGQADWGAVRAIRALVRKNGTDLIHTHGYKADLYVYAAQMKNLPAALVATSHNWPGRSVAMRTYAVLDRLALRRFDRVAAVSEVVAGKLRTSGIKESQVAYIANGVPIPERKAQPTLALEINKGNRILIGTVARLSSEKGLNLFLEAAKQLTTEFPEALFVIVGEGPERASLEQQAKTLGLEKSVIFAGARSDLGGVYASLDVFLMTSLNEGMPLALLEAMAAGLPVVATRVGAIPSLIPDASKGALIEPGSTAAIVQGITPLLRDGELRRKVGENAREHVREKFSAGRMAERYLQLYAEARGEGLAFLDADCLVPSEWLRDASKFLSNENEGIVGAHYRIPPDSTWLARSWFDDEHANTAGDTSYVPAGDVLLRKGTFVKIGGFDEKLETNEDYEFCQRAQRLGIPLRSYPCLEVIHLGTPQKIARFYRQQRWHGRHVFKVFMENLPSLYNARAVFFAIYTLLSVLGLVAGIGASIATGRPMWLYGAVCFLLLGPILLAARSTLKRRKPGIFLPLILLYFLYGAARASCLLPQLAISQWKSVPVPNQ